MATKSTKWVVCGRCDGVPKMYGSCKSCKGELEFERVVLRGVNTEVVGTTLKEARTILLTAEGKV